VFVGGYGGICVGVSLGLDVTDGVAVSDDVSVGVRATVVGTGEDVTPSLTIL
jgi:hypothetical protein